MGFGLCVRVLVISLLIFGQQAKALSYRSGGSSGITPHFDFSRSLKPASTSSDDSSGQPERVLGSYSPFHADGALSETLKPAAAPSAGGYSGSHGRQVGGYSPEGSVSSYGPSQPIIRKPNQLPQANPSANGVLPSKAAPWAFPLPHNPNSFQSGIASSSAIVMHSGPYSKPQKPKNLPKPQQAGYNPKPHQPKPQQAANPSNPLQSWYQPKPQQTKPNQPSYPSNPQQAKPYQPSNPQQAKPYQPSYPSNPQQAKPYLPAYPLNPQRATNPSSPLLSRYQPKPQQPSYHSNPQQAKPQQTEPLQGVLQSKAGMWYFPSEGSVSSDSNVQAKPYQPANPLNPQRATNPSSPLQSRYQPKPQHPAYPSNSQQAKPYRPSYPSNPQQAKPYRPADPSNPLQSRYRPKPQQPSYPSNPQQAKPYRPSYPSNPQQAKPYQPAYPSNPQQAKPLQWVLQSKAGMWNFPSQGSVASGSNVQPTDSNSHLNLDPSSLREIPMPFPYQPRWPQQLVPV
ncbi:DNA-directed RNA polymerase II subunit RPB1-like isoform X1 [Gymnodraco acuticeps]|uniref:DNA-directed RNA polymerase II subunit RPB1-like isoform X1 n=1 Tax=Gymnodraco acuticeps TaxID=8218 RepID=A0A6P8V0M0_GYMAC|nr:DNA-directed RNA polymerase II subunit RPB1-like isoform X1 [Gymnodraco acuticeps]